MKLYSLVCASFMVAFSCLYTFQVNAQKIAAGWMYMYSFDGNAYDVGPNRNHGTLVGNVISCKDRFGRSDKALRFDGGSGYIRIPFSGNGNLPVTNFTYTVWVYVDKFISTNPWESVKTADYSPIFCKTETSPYFQYRFGVTNKGFYFDGGEEGNSKGLYTYNNIALETGKWNMLTVSYNGYVMKLFLNDRLVSSASISTSFIQNQENLIIGCDLPGQANFFSGMMDDFSIWERFLTEEDVKQIYSIQSKNPFIPPIITIPVKKDTSVTVIIATIKDTSSKVQVQERNSTIFEVSKGSTVVLKHVLFVQSKAELLSESYSELDKLVATLKQYPDMVIEVSGHTDNQGSRDLNVKLSEERAITVKDYLVKHDIDSKRISCKGYGPDQPISSNNTEEQRRLNRRVEFKIIQM